MTFLGENMTDAEFLGYMSFFRRAKPEDNPFVIEEQNKEWQTGYRKAQKEFERKAVEAQGL